MTQKKFKFPRTFHSTDSEGVGSDDKIFHDWKEVLLGKPVEISIKYDGETQLFMQTELFMPVQLTPGITGAVISSCPSGKLEVDTLSRMVGGSL